MGIVNRAGGLAQYLGSGVEITPIGSFDCLTPGIRRFQQQNRLLDFPIGKLRLFAFGFDVDHDREFQRMMRRFAVVEFVIFEAQQGDLAS